MQFPEAVKLIAEDIGDQKHIRPHVLQHQPYRRLVHLKQE